MPELRDKTLIRKGDLDRSLHYGTPRDGGGGVATTASTLCVPWRSALLQRVCGRAKRRYQGRERDSVVGEHVASVAEVRRTGLVGIMSGGGMVESRVCGRNAALSGRGGTRGAVLANAVGG